MPATETFTATLVVTVGGSPVGPLIAASLVSARVEDSIRLPAMFTLRYADPRAEVLEKAGLKVGAEVTLKVQTSSTRPPDLLLAGEVTALEAELGPSGMFAVVRGMDGGHRLQHGSRTTAYVNAGPGDIVAKVAKDHGLSTGVVDVSAPVFEHLTQGGISDWEFLSRLGDRLGARPWVRDQKLHFTSPTRSSTAPAAGGSADPLVLERGVDLEWVRATLTSTGQVPSVEVRGWDPGTKKAVVGTATAGTVTAAPGPAASGIPGLLAKDVGAPAYVVSRPGLSTETECTEAARSLAERLSGGFAEIEGGGYGNPSLAAGVAVRVLGVGRTFTGTYTLTQVQHEFSEEGFRTSFLASGASDRSLYGVTAGADLPAADPGVLPATVTNIKDPEGLGRVKVEFPTYSGDYESAWARVVQVGAGSKRGTVVLPEVRDEVLVVFAGGDFNAPFVLGGLFNGKDVPDKAWEEHVGSDGTVARRAFTSRTGMLVEFLERPGEESVVVSTNAGAQHVTLTQKPDANITVVAKGPITVTAEKEISVEAQQNLSLKSVTGDILLDALNVKINAQTGVEVKGTKVSVAGTATTEVTGGTVKVAGDAAAELSGGATTTIRGALVKIN